MWLGGGNRARRGNDTEALESVLHVIHANDPACRTARGALLLQRALRQNKSYYEALLRAVQ